MVCGYLLGNSEVRIWLVFFILPHSLVFFLSVEAERELSTEGKRLKLYFGVYNYSVVWNDFLNL